MFCEDDCDYYNVLSGTMGSAHSVSSEKPERDVVAELRKTVEEVTRVPAPRVIKMGFY